MVSDGHEQQRDILPFLYRVRDKQDELRAIEVAHVVSFVLSKVEGELKCSITPSVGEVIVLQSNAARDFLNWRGYDSTSIKVMMNSL